MNGGRLARARFSDLAFFLPVTGFLLLTPIFLNLFTQEQMLWGLPLEVIYLFVVWGLLILGAIGLSRKAPRTDRPEA